MSLGYNLIWILIAYLIGSVPTAYIVGKKARGIDIREHGSGNVGATNVFRVVGRGWGTIVLLTDVLKGVLVTAVIAVGADAFTDLSPALKQLLFGFAAIAGHTWTPWLSLKGGKGVATAAGALIGIFPSAALFALGIWGIVFVIKKYVSLASIIAAAVFPVLLLIFYRHIESFALVVGISILLVTILIYNHRDNITRLKRGEEHRVNFP